MKRVLVTDDDRVTRKFLQKKLEESGFDVILASDGIRAWQFLEDNSRIDLVISDVVMPGLSGTELLERIREDLRFDGLPVTLISNRINVSDISDLLEQGATSFMPKPVDPKLLRDEIARLLPSSAPTKAGTAPAQMAVAVVLDVEATLARLEGDHELLADLAETFLEDYEELLETVVAAAAEGDADATSRAAHGLKSAASMFEAPRLARASLHVETLGRSGCLDTVGDAIDELRKSTAEFADTLKQMNLAV